ncbi:ATP-binding protein [Streptomyces sp. NPDC055607]
MRVTTDPTGSISGTGAAVTFRGTGAPSPPRFAEREDVGGQWRLEHRPEAAAEARRIGRRVLDAWGVEGEARDVVLLVISELVTNSVEHAVGPLRLRIDRSRRDGRLRVEVTDGGPAAREGAWTRSCARDEHGRGLALVKAVTEVCGTRVTGRRTTHWARVDPAGTGT